MSRRHPAGLAFRDRRDFKSRWQLSRQVFQRMHGEINSPGGQGFFNLFGEHPLGANHRERNISNLVAGSMDDFNLNFVPARAQQCGNMVGLPEGELRAAGADAEFRHGAQLQPGYSTKAKGGWLGRLERLMLCRA